MSKAQQDKSPFGYPFIPSVSDVIFSFCEN